MQDNTRKVTSGLQVHGRLSAALSLDFLADLLAFVQAAAVGDQGIINRLLEAARELDQEADALEATELFAAPEAVPDVGQVQHVQMQAQQQQSNPIVARRDDDRDEES